MPAPPLRDAGLPGARLLLPNSRSDLRATWHAERGELALSLWRGDVCVGTARLDGEQAGELAAFVSRHLGTAAASAAPAVPA